MTDNNARTPQSAEGAAESASAQASATASAEASSAQQDTTGDTTEALVKEVAELKDRLLRTLAEMENLRRRTEREVADSRAYGISSFARDLLGVGDNLRRALEAIGPEARETLAPPMTAFVEGVELTERELLKVLEKHGVRRFDPLGEKFDPNIHQAMFEVPDPSKPAGTVVQVVQAGFMIGERVLRPALVGVAKGGPKSTSSEGQEERQDWA
ncbi:MAG: nucleotide exchange factor GrpE [Xanthobacteraceae bacterium]